jgi:8-oxo-dGTP pyrophosphatase MutT (NUDIX family)
VKISAKRLSPSKLRNLRGSEQVAAVCYRLRGESIQFLLVRTGGGRWTFPKGCAEPGLSHAQAAALEAFEEAGVHGCMQEESFARYVLQGDEKAAGGGRGVNAYLCEVSRLVSPEESRRKPTWFSMQVAKKRLRADRSARDGLQFAKVVDLAAKRIYSACSDIAIVASDNLKRDPLQRAPFEAGEVPVYSRYRAEGAADLYRMLHKAFQQAARSVHAGSRPARPLLSRLSLPMSKAHVVAIDKPHHPPDKALISTPKSRRTRPTIG